MFIAMLAATALLADATPAAQNGAAPAAQPAAKSDVVCKSVTNVGELVPRKVCVSRPRKAAPAPAAAAAPEAQGAAKSE